MTVGRTFIGGEGQHQAMPTRLRPNRLHRVFDTSVWLLRKRRTRGVLVLVAALSAGVGIGIERALSTPSRSSARTLAAQIVWNGDVSTADLSQYYYKQACPGPNPPAGVTVVNAPIRPGYAFSSQFTVSDQSIQSHCPALGSSGHPNANIQSPPLFSTGNDLYIGFSTYFPSTFPFPVCTPYVGGCWMQVMEIYGAPYKGPSPISLNVWGSHFELWNHTGTIWSSPTNITPGTWQDTVFHVHFDTSASVGFVEVWLNGVMQTFANGSQRFYDATLQPGVNCCTTPDRLYLDQYRGANPTLGTVTLYHAAVKVATTYAAAAP